VDNERFEKVLRTLRGGATRRGVLAAVAGVAGMRLSETTAKRRGRSSRKQRRGAAQLSAAAAEAAEFQSVTITTEGGIVGGSQSGTFVATGGITDTGTYTFAEDLHRYFTFGGIGAPTFGIVRSVQFFVGADGTFDLQNVIKFAVTDQRGVFSVTGTWTVLSGTGAYARLHGQGQITGVIDASVNPETFDFTFTGTVHFA
jgi:hypothetical protein